MTDRRLSTVLVFSLSCICCQAERSEVHAGAETVTTISTADAPSAEAGSTPPPGNSGGAEGESSEPTSGSTGPSATFAGTVRATPGPLQPDPDDPTEILFAYPESIGADEVMVDEQWVYWSNGSSLMRGLKTGKGEVSTFGLTGMWHATMQLAQDADHVYWVRDEQLVQVNKRTAATQTFSYGDFNPFGGALTVSGGRALSG